jgi:hypothetical protein
MRFETFRPGDATISVVRGNTQRLLFVDVRAAKLGPVNRAPLTKLTAGSAFFSAGPNENPDPDPTNHFAGRPVKVNRGGSLINLRGEFESPQFEDYQVDLDHSSCLDRAKGVQVFRPFANDVGDFNIMIASGAASHITMRNTPLLDTFIETIKRIAQPKCLFTFSGDAQFENDIRSQLPGTELELLRPDPTTIRLAWQLK